MSWRNRLATAKWRGQEFQTDEHTAQAGRRLVVYEFPGLDVPLTEDFGAKAAEWRINAWFIGSNYDTELAGFVRLLSQPGADWLVHPWLGDLWVRPKNWTRTESNDKQGFAGLVITFVPGGANPPTASLEHQDIATASRNGFIDTAVEDYIQHSMSANALAAFTARIHAKTQGLRNAISLTRLPLNYANQIQQLAGGIANELGTLLDTPRKYALALAGLARLIGGGRHIYNLTSGFASSNQAAANALSDLARPRLTSRLATIAAYHLANATSGLPRTVASNLSVRANLRSEAQLSARMLVAAAAGVALADYRVAEDRDLALATSIKAIDSLLPTMADTQFQAALAMRNNLQTALLAQDLQPTRYRQLAHPLPATLLAHQMGVDEAVFIACNRVAHPLFVSGNINA